MIEFDETPDDVGLWFIWLQLMDGEDVLDKSQVGIRYDGRRKADWD